MSQETFRSQVAVAAPRPVRWKAGILILALVAILAGLAVAAAFAPELRVELNPARIGADGGYSYTFSLDLGPTWPYVVPSHPDAVLSAGDVVLIQQGEATGSLEPSHEEIRRLGLGRYDLWQGGLWFSTPDNTDPRRNGRFYVVLVKARLNGPAKVAGLVCILLLGCVLLSEALRPWAANLLRRFREVFLVVNLGVLGIWAALTASRPMPPIYMSDSFDYVYPGLLLAAGKLAGGISVRDLGYPIVSAAAVSIGSLAAIPRLQLGMVVLGVAAVLVVLVVFLNETLRRLALQDLKLASFAFFPFVTLGGAFCILLFSHDDFVVNIYRIMAEAPHFLPTALAFMGFVLGWMSRSGRSRVLWLAVAACTAFASSVFKPNTLLVFVLCAASLAVCCIAQRRSVRWRSALAISAFALGFVVIVHRLDVWITPSGNDFGPKTLFCNHLDAALPAVGSATTERATLSRLLEKVVAQGPHGWPIMGYNGDLCFYSQPVADAIQAASKADGMGTANWLRREFLEGILSHPFRYARDVARQFLFYFDQPILDIDNRGKGSMPEGDWSRLQPFMQMIGMGRNTFETEIGNWFTIALPDVAESDKTLLRMVSSSFAAVVWLATILALINLWRLGLKNRIGPELAILATGCFTVAFAAATALSHTFDVFRYSTGVLPFSLTWWAMGIVYLFTVAASFAAGVAKSLPGRRLAPK